MSLVLQGNPDHIVVKFGKPRWIFRDDQNRRQKLYLFHPELQCCSDLPRLSLNSAISKVSRITPICPSLALCSKARRRPSGTSSLRYVRVPATSATTKRLVLWRKLLHPAGPMTLCQLALSTPVSVCRAIATRRSALPILHKQPPGGSLEKIGRARKGYCFRPDRT